MKRPVLSLIVVFLFLSVSATDYYVSKDGNDSNAGTEAEPFLTIGRAADIMVAGDVCYIKSGTYRETISPANSGSAGNPIVFKSFETDTVLVSATEVVENWEVHKGNIYKASATMPLGVQRNMLYAGNRAMDIARWPNNVDGDPFTLEAELVTNGSGSHIESDELQNINWTDGYMWYLGGHSGASWTRRVTSSSSNRIDFVGVDITKWPFTPHNPTIVRNDNRGRFFLFGKLEALDHEGEWYYDSSSKVVYFNAWDNKDPNTFKTEVSFRKEAILITKDYIEIDGLHVFGGSVELEGDNCVLKNCFIKYGFQSLDELDNTDAQMANGSINVHGSNTLVERNLVESGSSNGIAMLFFWKGSKDNTINNNIIRNFNTIGIHSNGIRSNTPGTTITNNTVYKCGRDGIYTSGANANVSYNDVYECMQITNDGGVFYTVGNSSDKNSVIHHNWFHDSQGPDYADGRAAGIYLDNDSKGYDVHHNMVWNVTWTGIQINWDNWNLGIYNNSLYDIDGAMGRWENGRTIDNINIYNNYASEGEWIGTDVKNNIIDEDSPFTSFSEKDFTPRSSSGLVDTGIEVDGITDGFIGPKPDIGAYESGDDHWIPGTDWFVAESMGEQEEEEEEEEDVLANLSLVKNLVFPNPVESNLNLNWSVLENSEVTLSLYNYNGQKVLERSIIKGDRSINLSSIHFGMYFLRVQDGNTIHQSKILKK
ncbi:MAG: T9SS type A sorting domain-containing protein [Cyclobacteriaceae bacterium]